MNESNFDDDTVTVEDKLRLDKHLMNFAPAFITGSHAYGEPREDSDIDLVILCNKDTSQKLCACCDDALETDRDYGRARGQIRFGKLNIIDLHEAAEFNGWRLATRELAKCAPATRETAIVVIDKWVEHERKCARQGYLTECL